MNLNIFSSNKHELIIHVKLTKTQFINYEIINKLNTHIRKSKRFKIIINANIPIDKNTKTAIIELTKLKPSQLTYEVNLPIEPKMAIANVLLLDNISKLSNIPFQTKVVFEFKHNSIEDLKKELIGDLLPLIYKFSIRKCEPVIQFILNSKNLDYGDDLILFCKKNNVCNYYLSLAEDIFTTNTSKLDRIQRFHCVLLFDNLSRQKRMDPNIRYYYKYLSNLLQNKEWDNYSVNRKITKTISVAPDNIIVEKGNTIANPDQLHQRPMHVVKEIIIRGKAKLIKINTRNTFSVSQINIPTKSSPNNWDNVIITGWYGTETAGDKAILGELLHFIKSNSPECQIYLTTIYPVVSEMTKIELKNLEDVVLVDITKAHHPSLIEKVDAVIIGGGPLMQSTKMYNLWKIFKEANRQKKARIIFGCGIGPIHTELVRNLTVSILQMATAGFVRDKESHEYASKLHPGHVLNHACDPAFGFIARWKRTINSNSSLPVISGLLRANTTEFYRTNDKQKCIRELNSKIAITIAKILESNCKDKDLKTKLLHMNAPWIGGDDRVFNRYIEEKFENKKLVYNERGYLPLENLLIELNSSYSSIAMRYHGHIFCATLGIPFLSIDYTGENGKVSSLINRLNYKEWSINWLNMESKYASRKLMQLIEEHDKWSIHLTTQADIMVNDLYDTYHKVFELNQSLKH